MLDKCRHNFQRTKTNLLVEPDRVFIGNEPDLLKRVRGNQTKFIKSIAMNKVVGATMDDVWFDNFNIDLNSDWLQSSGTRAVAKVPSPI